MYMIARDQDRSESQQFRDIEEAEARRRNEEALNRKYQAESDREQAEHARRAAERREEKLKNLTADELKTMSPEEIAKAYDQGLINHLTAPPANSTGEESASTASDDDAATQIAGNLNDLSPEDLIKHYSKDELQSLLTTVTEAVETETGPVSADELKTMSPEEIAKAYDAGRTFEQSTVQRNQD